MNILITGYGGLLGSLLYDNLKKNNNFKIFTTSKKKINKKFNKICLLEKFESKNKFDVILHCAHLNIRNKNKSFYEASIKGCKNLLDLSVKSKTKLFINFSSISVYDNVTQNKIINENDIGCNLDGYAWSKYQCENLLDHYGGKKTNCTFISLRLGGINDKNNIKTFIPGTIDKIKKNEYVYFANLDNKFNKITGIEDILRLINYLIKIKNLSNLIERHEVFNFCSKYPVKLNQVKSLIDMNFEEYKYKILDDNKNFIISNAKIKKKLKFSLSTTKHNIKRILL